MTPAITADKTSRMKRSIGGLSSFAWTREDCRAKRLLEYSLQSKKKYFLSSAYK
jgi:hypothetical protein